MQVVPAIIPKTREQMEEEIKKVSGFASLIQIDISDGLFTPFKTWPFNGRDVEYFENLKNHYSRLVIKYGDSYKSVDWGSENTQKIRFRTLLEALDFQSARILDVGCGVGHLVDYLLENKFKGSYTGVDLVEEMVRQAANRYPEMNFIKIDSLDDLNRTDVELVIASGLFTLANIS